jgi:hypothetical protein
VAPSLILRKLGRRSRSASSQWAASPLERSTSSSFPADGVEAKTSIANRSPNIIGGEVGPAQALLARHADADHPGIGEAVGPGGPAELLRALAIGVEHDLILKAMSTTDGPFSRKRKAERAK